MAGIDGLLNLVDRQGANELRLGSDREPQMFADGAQKRLVIPRTTLDTLRELLGDLLTSEREKAIAEQGHVQVVYETPSLGPFRVTMTRRGPAWAKPVHFDVVFLRGRGKAGPSPAPPRLAEVSRPANDPVAAPALPTGVGAAIGPDGATGGPGAPAATGMLPTGVLPSGVLATGMLPNGMVVTGMLPTGMLPNGVLPNGVLPNGVLPNGMLPTGMLPTGMLPTGMAATGGLSGAFGGEPRIEAGPELSSLLARASAMRASDVHLLEGDVPVLRIDGRLRPLSDAGPVDLARVLGASVTAAASRRMATGASADLALGVEGVGRFRLNVFQTADGPGAAIRLLQSAPPSLAQLGAPIPLDDVVDLPHGLVLVCGPTGSGKSTTLAALAREALARRSAVVLTLEDPIEYMLSSKGKRGIVRQRQVGRDVRDFATGLRDALREDPDILLIGEMRDPETVSLALTAAETGHLVLASLHSRGAAAAVERIVDTYPGEQQAQIRVQLADSLRMVIAQRLIPRSNGEGRVLAAEILRGSHAVANAIREARTSNLQSAMQSGRREGMLPLERCLADLVQKRQISVDEARAVANDPAALGGYLAGT